MAGAGSQESSTSQSPPPIPIPPPGHNQHQQQFYQNNYNYSHGPGPGQIRRYRKNGFLLFLLSAVPGLNYMYLGLMKRGLFIMTLFFGFIFLAHEIGTRLFMFCVYILICFSLFDSFRVRRLLTEGFVVLDASDDILSFFKENKKSIILFFIIAVLFGIIGRIGRFFMNMDIAYIPAGVGSAFGAASNFLSFAAGLLVIVVGCYIVAKFISKQGKDKNQ